MASQDPWPLMPQKSIEMRMDHLDENVYTADSSTLFYKLFDAICGDAGIGALKQQIFFQRLGTAMETIYGSDLDYIFGNVHFLSRGSSEAYAYDPMHDMLTSDQWDEVKIKDALYRARIKDFFTGCSLGGTLDAIRMIVQAAASVDCDVYEVWRYKDSYGLTANLGRAPVSSRQEVVIRPHKSDVDPKTERLLLQMLHKVMPVDTIMTVNTNGLSVATPIPVRAAAADSTYYEVQKVVSPTPLLADIPPPELLAIDLRPSEQWLLKGNPETAPYAQFNITSEYGNYYLASGGTRSPIDSVRYGTLQSDGFTIKDEQPYELFDTTGEYTLWREWEVADSPDNYPGGKHGLTPNAEPALNPDHSPYQFPYESQDDYITKGKEQIIALGGQADDFRYRLPIQKESQSKRVFRPELAIAYNAPAKDSTITTSASTKRQPGLALEVRMNSIFVRS